MNVARPTGLRRAATKVVIAASLMFGITSPAAATTLTFEIFYDDLPCVPCFDDVNDTVLPILPAGYGYPEGFRISNSYGDNVTSTSMVDPSDPTGSIFNYGSGAEGFTPNVTVSYGPFSIFTGGPELWREGYGDLDGVLYQGSRSGPIGTNYDILDVVLSAEPGYDVLLYDFDLAGWFTQDWTINSVSLYSGVPFPFLTPTNFLGTPLTGVSVPGTGHLSFDASDFGLSALQAPMIWLRLDMSNLGDDSINVALDNIRFGQVENRLSAGGLSEDEIFAQFQSAEVPEPASLLLVLTGGVGAALGRMRQRRRHTKG